MQRTDLTNSIINSYKLKLVVDMSNGNPQTLFDNIFVLGDVWKISIKWELLCLDDRNVLFYMIKKFQKQSPYSIFDCINKLRKDCL